MHQVIEMNDEEMLRVYRETLTFDQLALMHIELLKHVPPPVAIYPEENNTAKKGCKYEHRVN